MPLKQRTDYFISQTSVVLRSSASQRSAPVNHLIFGDWLNYLGEESGAWVKVKCRGDRGWIRKKELRADRPLEINFLDIGVGDSCHIVFPNDQVMVIDSGKSDNLFRFLNWRYNLRGRRVKGVDGVSSDSESAKDPFEIDYVMISHPDKDHYYGFEPVFACRKLSVKTIFHNGIVERPVSQKDKQNAAADPGLKIMSDDLGRYTTDKSRPAMLWDLITSDSAMRRIIRKHKSTNKLQLSTLRKVLENPANEGVKFQTLSSRDKYVPGFHPGEAVELKLLGPVPEMAVANGKKKYSLRRLGGEDVTKNGHSIVMRLQIGKFSVFLGGDLNIPAEDFLLSHYTGRQEKTSEIEARIFELERKGVEATPEELRELARARAELTAIIETARTHFQVDFAKACHHGSHHFSEAFLQSLNAIGVVISSGDEENYAHPRPDALGAFGKYGRGRRPLIFSTEIARSTREATPLFRYFEKITKFQNDIENAKSDRARKKIEAKLHEAKDNHVAVYGMITLRTDGDKAVIAQKLEEEGGKDKKWDIHELIYNEARGEYEYAVKLGHH